jgi:hypothetical protein
MNEKIPAAQILEHQPVSTDIRMVDGVFAKTLVLEAAGLLIPQHAHKFAHVSVLVRGSIRAWAGDECLGTFEAPIGITIAARVKHTFLTLTPAVILCVHDIESGEIAIDAEHQIGDAA